MLAEVTKPKKVKNDDIIGIKVDLEIGTFSITINGEEFQEVYLNELK